MTTARPPRTSLTAPAANSRPRSIRTSSGTAPNGETSGSWVSAMRIAVSTVPEVGVAAMAQPRRARVPSSTTVVIHGASALPFGGRTRIGSCLWSISQHRPRSASGRRR
ncbi:MULTISPECIES: hypothetical protein [unclassified Streptomyces]|uniref:hypothetical protein n=1 Tax=unclassified Streptomyces TaxID=2593676 RepID=UPI0036534C0C